MTEVKHSDELQLIQQAVAGEAGAFDAVTNQYAARLRWLIRMRLDPALRARVSADDVLQDVLLVVSKQIRSLVIEHEGAFWTWLCRVVEQRLIDARRRHLQAAARDARREQPLPAPQQGNTDGVRLDAMLADSGSSPSARLRSAEQRAAFEAALAGLPPSYQSVIVMRILEGLSVKETAEIMERTPNAVSVLLTKAVKRLSERIAEMNRAKQQAAE